MPQPKREPEPRPEFHTLWLNRYDPAALRHIVDPDVPMVILENHYPRGRVDWYEAVIPVSETTLMAPRQETVRHVWMDLAMPVAAFLERIAEFEAFHQIGFYQMQRLPPSSFKLMNVKGGRALVHKQAGVELNFYAPSRFDPALASSIDRDVISRVAMRLDKAGIRYRLGGGLFGNDDD
jgi:hypothetical protein